MKVFLGGTSNVTPENPDYRDNVIPYLEEMQVDYFNPIVKNWTSADEENENYEKSEVCDVHLYIVNNAMIGCYSIAEIMHSIFVGKKTLVLFDTEGMEDHQKKSFKAIENLIMSITGSVRVYILDNIFELPLALESFMY